LFGTLLRSVLYVASVGLALHLILPRIPGIERSLVLVSNSSLGLITAAFLAFFGSQLCYAVLLSRSTAAATGLALASERRRRRRGLGLWFMLRLTVAEHGAARILPGGGSAAAAVTYSALRTRGLKPARVAVAVATISVLVYGTLATIFLASLVYLILDRELNRAATAASLLALVVTFCFLLLGYLSYRRPTTARRLLAGLIYRVQRLFFRRRPRVRAEVRAARLVLLLQGEVHAPQEQLLYHPVAALRLFALALGYWALDALCLFVVFVALGVPTGGVELFVAYGVAMTFGSLPLTPGGLGVFETAMIGTLALLGVGGYEAAIPVLGYRLFNYWLPIPLALVFYPTLHLGSAKYRRAEEPESKKEEEVVPPKK
jgi:glycosyltransferase 2 family protein